MQAATLETLVNLVAAGYGATLIPALAADSFGQREIVLRPLLGEVAADDSAGEPAGVSEAAGAAGARKSDQEGGELFGKYTLNFQCNRGCGNHG